MYHGCQLDLSLLAGETGLNGLAVIAKLAERKVRKEGVSIARV